MHLSQKIYLDPKEKAIGNFRPCDNCINTFFFLLGGSRVVGGRLGRYMPQIRLGVSLAHDIVQGKKEALVLPSC